jgi:hypothetical protein
VIVRIVSRVGIVAVAVLATSAVHLPGRPPTFCVLRALTGVPCPFCGGTTAAVHLGHGDVVGALAVSPIAVFMIAAAAVFGQLAAPRWWRHPITRRVVVATALVASELWQLRRYGFLPSPLG